jgi:hypothetical protein
MELQCCHLMKVNYSFSFADKSQTMALQIHVYVLSFIRQPKFKNSTFYQHYVDIPKKSYQVK